MSLRSKLLLACLVTLLWTSPSLAQRCQGDSGAGFGVTSLENETDAKLFTPGNFHTERSPGGPGDVSDLVFVRRLNLAGAPRWVLSVLLSSGEGCFTKPLEPANGATQVVAGDDPSLIAVADVDNDGKQDVIVVDAMRDAFTDRPKLRLFYGDGQGHFSNADPYHEDLVSVVSLDVGERPVAVVAGRFRGGAMSPVDLAIASVPGSGGKGMVKLLFNNGRGEFVGHPAQPAPIFLGDLEPAVMVAGDGFRDPSRLDLILKEKASISGPNRIVHLQNAGNGSFPDIVSFSGAGNVDALQLGVLQSDDDAGAKTDIITFDSDMKLKIFANNNQGFTLKTPENPGIGEFEVVGPAPRLFAVNFGDRFQLRLIGLARRSQQLGALILPVTSSGDFDTPEFRVLPRISASGPFTNPSETPLFNSQFSPVEPRISLEVVTAMHAPFMNGRFGNPKSGLGFLARHLEVETKTRGCTVTAAVPHHRPSFPVIGPIEMSRTCINGGLQCEDGIAFCDERPVNGRCFCSCIDPTPPPPPQPVACEIRRNSPQFLVVMNGSLR